MNNPLNRRAMLAQSSAFASLFVLGELQLSAAFEAAEQLHAQAAATFEFVLQKLILPTMHLGKFVKPTPALRRESYAISHLLKPETAPEVFRAAQVKTMGDEISVVFSPNVSVRLTAATLALLKECLHRLRGTVAPPDVASDVKIVIWNLSQKSSWLDD